MVESVEIRLAPEEYGTLKRRATSEGLDVEDFARLALKERVQGLPCVFCHRGFDDSLIEDWRQSVLNLGNFHKETQA